MKDSLRTIFLSSSKHMERAVHFFEKSEFFRKEIAAR